MAISRRRALGNDCHNMSLLSEKGSTDTSSDHYEVRKDWEKRYYGSGTTKKSMGTRRSLDNNRMFIGDLKLLKLMVHDRYFKHGPCKTLSESEKRECIKKRNIEKLMEMRNLKEVV